MKEFNIPNFDLNKYIKEKDKFELLEEEDVIVSVGNDGILEYKIVIKQELPPHPITIQAVINMGAMKVLTYERQQDIE